MAFPATRSGIGPSSMPRTSTLNRFREPRLSCTPAAKSAMKCGGQKFTSTSNPMYPWMLKPYAAAYRDAFAPNCRVFVVIAR